MLARTRFQRKSRGVYRGFFACMLVVCCSCDRKAPKQADGASTPDAAAESATADVGSSLDDARTSDVSAAADSEERAEFAPPWTEPSPDWEELKKSLADRDVGRLSGEIFGSDRVVRGVVRGSCGAGTMLQFVYQNDEKLQVTPVIPVKFFGMATGRPVTYEENDFRVTVNFEHDNPERLKGEFRITYDQKGVAKTYIDATVDAKPITALLEPRNDLETPYPEFQPCHPSGWFKATTADGRTAEGLVNATLAPNGDAAMVTVLMTEQTGFRFIVLRRNDETGPLEIQLDSPRKGAEMKVVPEVFYVDELTDAAEAVGMNLHDEEKVTAHQGKVVAELGQGETPKVVLRFTDLVIPMLLDGPLRGTTFDDLVIEAHAHPSGEYPDLEGAPSWAEEN